MEGNWKWQKCTNSNMRGLCLQPSGYVHGTPVYIKYNWKCTHCDEEENLQNLQLHDSLFNADENSPILHDREDEIYMPRIQGKGLCYAHIKINGLKSKLEEVKYLMNNEKNIVVLAITETKLNSKPDHPTMCKIENYTDIRLDRIGKEGGGTIIYIHNRFRFESMELDIKLPDLIECTVIKVYRSRMKIHYVCTLYVPSGKANETFFEFF